MSWRLSLTRPTATGWVSLIKKYKINHAPRLLLLHSNPPLLARLNNASRWRWLAFTNPNIQFCFISSSWRIITIIIICIDRVYSSHHLIPRATSAVSLETPSSETASVDSNNRRHYSIPNGQVIQTLTVDRLTASPQRDMKRLNPSTPINANGGNINNNNNNVYNSHSHSTSNSNNNNNNSISVTSSSRRLSIKEPPDSICWRLAPGKWSETKTTQNIIRHRSEKQNDLNIAATVFAKTKEKEK